MLSLRSKTQNKPQLGALNLGVTSRMKPVIKIESTDQDEWLKSILDVITKNWGKLGKIGDTHELADFLEAL